MTKLLQVSSMGCSILITAQWYWRLHTNEAFLCQQAALQARMPLVSLPPSFWSFLFLSSPLFWMTALAFTVSRANFSFIYIIFPFLAKRSQNNKGPVKCHITCLIEWLQLGKRTGRTAVSIADFCRLWSSRVFKQICWLTNSWIRRKPC